VGVAGHLLVAAVKLSEVNLHVGQRLRVRLADGTEKTLLVGDINALGGVCDDCPHEDCDVLPEEQPPAYATELINNTVPESMDPSIYDASRWPKIHVRARHETCFAGGEMMTFFGADGLIYAVCPRCYIWTKMNVTPRDGRPLDQSFATDFQ
jgi:hypothetical protein